MPSKPLDRALVPLDQPYGERGKTLDAMGQANLPLGPRAQRGIPNDMLAAVKPTRRADVAQVLAPPVAPPPDVRARLREVMLTTPNAIVRELLARTLGE